MPHSARANQECVLKALPGQLWTAQEPVACWRSENSQLRYAGYLKDETPVVVTRLDERHVFILTYRGLLFVENVDFQNGFTPA